MSNLVTSCRYDYEDFVDLEKEMSDKEGQVNKDRSSTPPCPRMTLLIFSVPVQVLIDTGSQITAISEDCHNYLILHGKFVELPICNITLLTAIGKKPTTIKKQVSCSVIIDDQIINTHLLVVPRLSNPIILGNDWLLKNKGIINYEKCEILINGIRIIDRSVNFGKIINKEIKNVRNPNDIEYIQTISNIELINDDKITDQGESTVSNDSFAFTEHEREFLSADEGLQLSRVSAAGTSGPCLENVNKDDSFESKDNIFSDCPEINRISGNIIRECDFDDSLLEDCKIFYNVCYDNYLLNSVDQDNNFIRDLNEVAIELTDINKKERQEFVRVMSQLKILFTKKSSPAHVEPYRIRVKSQETINRKTYPVPFKHRQKIDKTMDEMIKRKIIEPSNSKYCNPIRIVIKNDGTARVCLDARYINNNIESDHEAPPLISELLQKFDGINFMSITDLESGYWQIPLHHDSRKYTAFLYNSRMYQFCRVPFGLKTAGSAFIRSIAWALGSQFKDILTIYIDDFLLSTKGTFYEHLHAIERVFKVLQEKNFTLNLKKTIFLKKKVKFLGHEVSVDGIRPLRDKLNVISEFESPRNRTDLQRFLGICTYYRHFTVQHANLIEPFREILKGKNPWKWDENHEKAFSVMKKAFVNCVRLSHHMPGKKYRLQTDASDVGISGILYQVDDEGECRIVALVSRCLSSAEINYTTTEKELLAIIYAITKLRTYLIGQKFLIITDHKGLTFLNSTAYLNSRLIRWSLVLQQYDFSVEYCKGVDNVVADFFSRNPEGKFINTPSNYLSIDVLFNDNTDHITYNCNQMMYTGEVIHSLKHLEELQKVDPVVIEIRKKLENNELTKIFVIEHGILFRYMEKGEVWQIVIPETLTKGLINCVHTKLGHPGTYKTIAYISQYYYWKSMNRDIKKFVISCDLCQRVKIKNQNMEGAFRIVQSSEPGDLVSVDFFGPLPRSIGGMEYIFVVLDVFSKYVRLYPIKRETTDTVLRKLIDSYFPEMGIPKRILSDNGTQFSSPKWGNRLRDLGIGVIFSSVRHPQGNPVERVMRELGRLFRTLCADKHTRWAKCIGDIEFFLNATTHMSTGFSPMELHFGKKPKDQIMEIINFPNSIDVSRDAKIILAKARLKHNFDQRAKGQRTPSKISVTVGDLVLLHIPKQSDALKKLTKKFFHLYYGPYLVAKDFNNGSYELIDPANHERRIGIHNRANLKKYIKQE